MMLRAIPVLLLSLLASVSPTWSQMQDRPDYGIRMDFGLNAYWSDFTRLPTIPNCCRTFESASGTGFGVGLLGKLPLTSRFSTELRLGYSNLQAEYAVPEVVPVIVDGEPADALIHHELGVTLSGLLIEAGVMWKPTVRIEASLLPHLMIPLISPRFVQAE